MASTGTGPQINGILNIVVQQDATEIRMGCDRTPQLFQGGVKKRFVMPQTSGEMLRGLLGELLDGGVEAALKGGAESVLDHQIPSGEVFKARFKGRESEEGFDVVFSRVVEAPRAATPEEPAAASAGFAASSAEPAAAQVGAPIAPAIPSPPLSPRSWRSPQVSPELASLLGRAVMSRASDLHLGADELPTVRIDGRLQPMIDQPQVDTLRLLEPCMVPWVVEALDAGQSADLTLKVPSLGRFRVNIYRSSAGLTAAVRLLSEAARSLESLELPMDLAPLARLPHGLVIVTGPTGSGKSTTLAALAQESLMSRGGLLISIEDPIEYQIRALGRGGLVRQREKGRHVKDFATGLRDALREDPDVILVGEMREPETIMMALTAAETGHLVLTSLHSRSAPSAIERILDACPPERHGQVRAQLADSLQAIVAQRLLPRQMGRGRVAALEVLRVNHNVASLIREGRTPQLISAMQAGRAEGMVTLERALADRVNCGEVRLEDARAVVNDLADFEGHLDRAPAPRLP